MIKLKAKLSNSKNLMLEGKLEGASVFREVCKIVCNLLTITYQDEDEEQKDDEDYFFQKIQIFEKFCSFIDLANIFMAILKQMLDKNFVVLKEVTNIIDKFSIIDKFFNFFFFKQQLWYPQIVLDTVVLIHSYFVSQICSLNNVSIATRATYLEKGKNLRYLIRFFLPRPMILREKKNKLFFYKGPPF